LLRLKSTSKNEQFYVGNIILVFEVPGRLFDRIVGFIKGRGGG
jgi:hypothetical protein